MLRLKVTPVVGLPQFTGWSQVAESTASVSVRLVLVYAVSGKHAGNVGRDISEKVADFYFYDAEQLHDFLNQLVNYAHTQDCKIYFSCAVLGRNKSIFATYGGSVFLKRGAKSGKILMSDYQVKVVEGNYLEDDIFVLTTLQADQFLSEVQLKFQQGYDTDIIITSVVPGLHAQEDSSLSALVFISKDDQEVVEDKSFIEIEEDDLQEVSLDDQGAEKPSLAKIELEVDPVKVPVKLSSYLSKLGPLLKLLRQLLIRFLLFLKKLVLSFWQLLKRLRVKRFIGFFALVNKKGLKHLMVTRKQYLLEMKPRKNIWKLLGLAILIITTLVVIAFFSYSRNQEKKRIQALIAPLQQQVTLAKDKLNQDPIATREEVTLALEKLDRVAQENKTSSAVKLVTDKKQEWQSYLESISGREELKELDIFYDLRLAKSDFISFGIDVSNNVLALYDKDLKQVILLGYDSKQVVVHDLSKQENLKGLVLNDETAFVLADGVYKFKADLKQDFNLEEVRSLGDSNRNATLIEAYDRFVYVVNPEKRNIYRYSKGKDGYSEPVGWMKSASGLDYSKVRSISVDGDVWLTTSNGDIKKFSSGFEQSFNTRGLEVGFAKDIYLYTNDNLSNLYVLDPNNNRVVVLSKAGDFIKEFKSVSLGAASNLAVSEDLGKIFVVSGSLIYQIDL